MERCKVNEVWQRLNWSESVWEVAARLGAGSATDFVFFDTAQEAEGVQDGGLSVLGVGTRQRWTGALEDWQDFQKERVAGGAREEFVARATPFGQRAAPASGWAGWVSYEGEVVMGAFSNFLVFDHAVGQWWLGGKSERDRLAFLKKVEKWESPRELWSPLREADWLEGDWEASLSEAQYLEAVLQAQRDIAAGDIYQVNVARQWRRRLAARPEGANLLGLYGVLREASPTSHAAYLRLEGREVLSSSPECFLRWVGREIETRPIKGTRPRGKTTRQDTQWRRELHESEKERAELLMITDLERNDLGQVCEFGSVEVTELMRVESWAQVHHLVSTVRGRLREGVSGLEALAACSPGGSITGAPKKRAREIIAELESSPRGLYTGAAGFLGDEGVGHFNLLIRTLVADHRKGVLSFGLGAGIVADSSPEAELAETKLKGEGLRLALAKWGRQGPLRAGEWIVFFDGECGLCQRSVRLLHHLDDGDVLRFAPWGGETARQLGVSAQEAEASVGVWDGEEGRLWGHSEAVVRVLRRVGGVGAVGGGVLSLMPRSWRDRIYEVVARRRQKFWKKREVCDWVRPELRAKMRP